LPLLEVIPCSLCLWILLHRHPPRIGAERALVFFFCSDLLACVATNGLIVVFLDCRAADPPTRVTNLRPQTTAQPT